MELEKLLQQSGEYKPMSPGGYNLSLVYGYGEEIAKLVNWSPDLDINELIKRNGGTIHYIDYAVFRRYPDIFQNSIYVRSEKNFDIILPAYAGMVENRFTLAHELGHYVLHSKTSPMSYACRNGDTPVEKEADCFALGFMMPSDKFREACEKYKTLFELSLVFRVPELAVKARALSLAIDLT